MTQDLKTSSQLFGTYLHQDWADEFDDDVDAVSAMLASEPQESILEASLEIKSLLAKEMNQEELALIMMDQIGCYFDPASKGQSYREWLSSVLNQWEKNIR